MFPCYICTTIWSLSWEFFYDNLLQWLWGCFQWRGKTILWKYLFLLLCLDAIQSASSGNSSPQLPVVMPSSRLLIGWHDLEVTFAGGHRGQLTEEDPVAMFICRVGINWAVMIESINHLNQNQSIHKINKKWCVCCVWLISIPPGTYIPQVLVHRYNYILDILLEGLWPERARPMNDSLFGMHYVSDDEELVMRGSRVSNVYDDGRG